MDDMVLTTEERVYLRDLAKRYLEYASRPVMAERAKLWKEHNQLRRTRPPIVMELGGFAGDFLPPCRCMSPLARAVEWQLLEGITNEDKVGDDKVMSPYFGVDWAIRIRDFDLDVHSVHGTDANGRQLGFRIEHPVTDVERDVPGLKHSVFHVDRDASLRRKAEVEALIGDILPVRMWNRSLNWYLTPSAKIVWLMGMETMLVALMDHPDIMKGLYDFIRDDMLAFMAWQEREGLLELNNGNDYVGSGSYGFTDELPAVAHSGRPRLADLWGNLNSQETVGMSPGMFNEFVFPAYRALAEKFGLVYYGCCEPVHETWADSISRLPHLRKVSVSAWCDEETLGAMLKGGRVIYSRKPSPNYLSYGPLNEATFGDHIARTLKAAQGCSLEFIFRDVYTLDGDNAKPGRVVQIVRQQIDRLWQ